MPDAENFDEIDWNEETVLMPGVDYHDGTMYFTVPLNRTVTVPSKKKGEAPLFERRLATYAVSSERQGVWYDTDALKDIGFVPHQHLYQDAASRWSRSSVRAFLEGNANAPATKDLYNEIRSIYTSYVEFADETYFDLMTLYLMYTYVYQLFEATGYIHFNGTASSGKSRNLSILRALAFNTVWAASMSAASLYRKLAGSPGTTCLDETEGFDGERGEELRRILNAGYRRGAQVTRTEKVGASEVYTPVLYDVYGPKALASINTFDTVIGSRCLVVNMRPAIRELPDFAIDDPRWNTLRDKLYLWALTNGDALWHLLQIWRNPAPDGRKAILAPKLIGRQWEISTQFVVLADYIGGPELTTPVLTFLNTYFSKQQESLDATDRLRTTLRCLPRVLATKHPHPPGMFYSVKDIHEVITSYMETDATEYFKTKHVTKNLEVLGFREKHRATGGLQIRINEAHLRHEFQQRRVEPFEEDTMWLASEHHYQTGAQPAHAPTPTPERSIPWWEASDENDLDGLLVTK